MLIYCYPILKEDEQSYFHDALDGVAEIVFNDGSDQSAEKEKALAAEVIVGNPPPAWVEASRSLKLLQLDSVGIDNFAGLDWGKFKRRITVCNLAGFFSESVAEEVLAGILMIYRCIPQLITARTDGQWRNDLIRPQKRVLAGAEVLVFGCGSIGRRLIELLDPFACQVTTIGRAEMTKVGKTGLVEAASKCDIFVSTVPDTESTHQLLDEELFTAIGTDGLFINCGRGGVVDESALVSALTSGKLGTAYLDVTCSEPLPSNSALWTCPRLFLSQHTGGGFQEEDLRKIDLCAVNIRSFINGGTVQNVIDWERGF